LIELEVFGDPAPQGSKRVFNGRVVEASGAKLKTWRKAIAVACHELVNEQHSLLLEAVRVEIDFYLPRPASVTIKKRRLPIVPPYLDKLCRGVLDGIGQGLVTGKVGDGIIYGDDSQVVELVARKHYADDRAPGAVIKISAL
jgi:Holliday junction resolvase RusA-like endonuclease